MDTLDKPNICVICLNQFNEHDDIIKYFDYNYVHKKCHYDQLNLIDKSLEGKL